MRTLLRTFFAAGFGAGAFAVAALGLQSGDPGRVEDQPNLMEINQVQQTGMCVQICIFQ